MSKCKGINDLGSMRHFVELQSAGTSRDTYGEQIQSWTKYGDAWAAIRYVAGEEKDHAQQVSGQDVHKIKIRYRDDVSVKHRVLWNSRIFEINSIQNPEERNILLILHCSEVR